MKKTGSLPTDEEVSRYVELSFGRRLIRNQLAALSLILLGMVVILSLLTRTFLTATNIFNVLRAFSWIAIASFGQSIVIIGGGIDLSAGSNMALSGIVAAMFLVRGYGVAPSVTLGLLITLLVGLANGTMASKTKLPPFIATLGTMSIVRGFCYGMTEGWPVRNLPRPFLTLGQTDVNVLMWQVPLPAILMVVSVVLYSILLSRTKLGYHIYAVGGNEYAAGLAGINIDRVKIIAFALSGLLAGIGGILMTARLGVAAPTAAQGYELDIIAAAVIGGISLSGGRATSGEPSSEPPLCKSCATPWCF